MMLDIYDLLRMLVKRRSLWMYWARLDIRSRYERSRIGSFWLLLHQIIFVGALSLVWAKLFALNLKDYLPYFATSYALWLFFSNVVSESLGCIVAHANIIKNIKICPTIFFARVVFRNAIVMKHIVIVPLTIVAITKYDLIHQYDIFTAISLLVGILVFTVSLYFVSVLVSLLAARYQDFGQMVMASMQILFLFTPILWTKESAKAAEFIYIYNPVFHYFEMVRQPILTGTVPIESTVISIVVAFLLGALSYTVLLKMKARVVEWV